MASKTREKRIIASIRCPKQGCGAEIGRECYQLAPSVIHKPLFVHSERIKAWQHLKRKPAEVAQAFRPRTL